MTNSIFSLLRFFSKKIRKNVENFEKILKNIFLRRKCALGGNFHRRTRKKHKRNVTGDISSANSHFSVVMTSSIDGVTMFGPSWRPPIMSAQFFQIFIIRILARRMR